MGVGECRPVAAGVGAVRKLVVVSAALAGAGGITVPPDLRPALEAVSYRRPVAVDAVSYLLPVAVSVLVPAAVSYLPVTLELSTELMEGMLSKLGSIGNGRRGELLTLSLSCSTDPIVLGTPKLASEGAPLEGKNGTSN